MFTGMYVVCYSGRYGPVAIWPGLICLCDQWRYAPCSISRQPCISTHVIWNIQRPEKGPPVKYALCLLVWRTCMTQL